ncbi:MAG: hypothetical protein WA125_17645 [Desulfosporosinus sp.]
MVKYSHLEFEEKLKSKYGNRFTLLSEYTTAQGYVLVKCNECGEISEKQAVKLLQRGTCNGCAIKRHTKTHEEFTKQITNKYGGEFTILGKYTRDKNKIRMRHNKCGGEYEVVASVMIQHPVCSVCQSERIRKKLSRSQDDFIGLVKELVGEEYTFLGEYKNANTKALFKHNKCGHEYMTRPNMFILGRRCPRCAVGARRSRNPENRKIARNIRSRIIHVLQGRIKSSSTLKLLGCTIEELKLYLESLFKDGMNWDNYGKRNGWQIGHVRPCASFNLSNPQQQKECFRYANLQPLWAIDNIIKHSWWNGKHYGGSEIEKTPSSLLTSRLPGISTARQVPRA